MEKESTCFFTGHRDVPKDRLGYIRERLEELITELYQSGVTDFVCGGAVGFDTLAAQAVERLRDKHPISLHLILPCKDQHKYFDSEQKEEYTRLLAAADSVEVLFDSYVRGCMHARNRRMADISRYCIAFCESDSGGTAYTVRYAKKLGLEIINI